MNSNLSSPIDYNFMLNLLNELKFTLFKIFSLINTNI